LSLRQKILFGALLLDLVFSALFSVTSYVISSRRFFDQFREFHLTSVRSAAVMVDGRKHSEFRSAESMKDPEFTRMLNALRITLKENHSLTFLYTLNYDARSDRFLYAVDATEVPYDLIWLESPEISLVYFVKDGKPAVRYDEKVHTADFTPLIAGKTYAISFDGPRLLINGKQVLELEDAASLKVRTSAGSLRPGSAALTVNAGELEFFLTSSRKGEPGSVPGSPFVENQEVVSLLRTLVREGRDHVDDRITLNSYGEYLSGYGLIRDAAGAPVGVLGMDVSAESIRNFRRDLALSSLMVFAVTFVVIGAVSLSFAAAIIRPLLKLTRTVQRIGEGDLDARIVVARKDEIGRLAQGVNEMAERIGSVTGELLQTNDAFSRFVPASFLEHLGKTSILDVRLGDQTLKQMTVLFTDVRSFTTMSEKMSPEDNFNFINSLLSRIGPVVRDHGGFIDKYIGDAVMALFPGSPRDAVRAAIGMQEEVVHLNEHRGQQGYDPVAIGVGIHAGALMLGVVGEAMRYDGTVISDAVNVASRIESLTKKLGSQILVTEAVREHLGGEFGLRFMGRLRVKGKTSKTPVYEVFDAEDETISKLKQTDRSPFERAVELFEDRRYAEAAEAFRTLAERNPGDRAAEIYLQASLRAAAKTSAA
jgi:class 3 adenylate cyclase